MFDIIAPASAPQIPHQLLAGVQHPLAPALIQAVRRHASSPVGLWKIINDLVKARKPATRDQGRCLCAIRGRIPVNPVRTSRPDLDEATLAWARVAFQ